MREKLPRRQEETLDHISAFVREHGYAPSIRDLCERMNLSSPATVHGHLRGLATRGLISMPSRQSRSILLSPDGRAGAEVEESVLLPLISHFRSGTAVLNNINWEAQIPVAALWLGECSGSEWLLRVSSDIATGAYHIGDYLLMRHTNQAPHDGEIVALPEQSDEAPLLSTRIVLEPFAASDERAVLGRVVGTFRPPL